MSDMKKRCDLKVLHVNLIEEIMAWLPVETVCRFRSLSKEWNAILSSRDFIINKWVKKPPNRNPWLVAVQVPGSSFEWLENGGVAVQAPGSLLASCFFNQTWQETSSVSLSFLQQHPEDISYKCFGSAAGLFLLERTFRTTDLQSTLVVCNPLTRRSLELPILSLDTIMGYSAGIISHSGDAYKVVVVGTGRKGPLRIEIYDSIDKSWRVLGRLPKYVTYVGEQLVFCDGYIYCRALISERRTLLVYNIAERTSMFRPWPPIADGQRMLIDLLPCGSRVLLAAQHIMRNSEQILEVIIWELEKVKLNSSSSSSWWKEIARMPLSHLEIFSIIGYSFGVGCNNNCCVGFGCNKRCVGVGDSICFMVIGEMKAKEILAYSVTENTWSWLPNRIWAGCEDPMAFEPRPDMKVD